MAKRGTYMGFTLPYGGVIGNDYIAIAENATVWNIRCGFPEVREMCSTPDSATLGTFDTTDLGAEVAAVHAAGMGYCFGFDGLPNECTGAGTGNRFPTTNTQRNRTADLAVACATEIMNSHRSTGLPVWIEILQEPNIHSFNVDDQAASVWAAALKTCIDRIRTAEPDLPIIAGSVANRGDIKNGSDPDVIAHWDGPHWITDAITAQPTLKTTSAPDYWGYHPYCGSSDPSSLSAGWGMYQMVAFGFNLATGGAKAPDGSNPKVSITEFGSIRTRDLTGTISGTANGSTNLQISGAGFVDGLAVDLGEIGALLTGTNIQSGTRIASVTSPTQVVMTKPATGTISGTITLSRDDWQAEHMRRQITTHDIFRKDGWVAGPEFTMEELGTEKSLFKSASPHNPFNAGIIYEFAAQTEPTIDPPPPPPPPPPGNPQTLTYKIEIGTPPVSARSTGTWVLDDPVRGKLDSGNVLADTYQWHEVTGDVEFFDIVRGSQNGFDRTEVGTATCQVRNDRADHGTAGDYSPFNWSSPMFPFLGPRSRLRITVDDHPLFCGDLTSLPVTDVRDNVVYTTFQAADFLAFLNKTIRYTPEAVHSPQQRIYRILEKAGAWERGENHFLIPDVYTFQAGTQQEGTALDMCADIQTATGGLFYANDSAYIFLSREHMEDAPPLMTWSDDPTEPLRYSNIVRNVSWDHMANTVSIRGIQSDAKSYSAHDEVSAGLYGDLPVEYTLPFATYPGFPGLNEQTRANQLLSEMKTPQVQVEQITIPTARYSVVQRQSYIYQEVGHVIKVERSAPGEVPSIAEVCVIVGIEHHASNGGKEFTTVFNLRNQYA